MPQMGGEGGGTNLIHADSVIQAQGGMDAVVDVLHTKRPSEPRRTNTLNVVDKISAGCALQAWRWIAVVYVRLTEATSVARVALAPVRGDSIDAGDSAGSRTFIVCALINVDLAMWTSKTGQTGTRVVTDSILRGLK